MLLCRMNTNLYAIRSAENMLISLVILDVHQIMNFILFFLALLPATTLCPRPYYITSAAEVHLGVHRDVIPQRIWHLFLGSCHFVPAFRVAA